jgi:hypothetical protein
MGFALWTDEELAWAAGTSEYRALGVAVIANTDLFRPADFRNGARRRQPATGAFIGHFASIGQVNQYLQSNRPGKRARRQVGQAPLPVNPAIDKRPG